MQEHQSNFYIEMGALDGIKYSNTHMYEVCAGWHGLLLEPSNAFNDIPKHRSPQSNILVNEAVCNQVGGTVKFANQAGVGPEVLGMPEYMADHS